MGFGGAVGLGLGDAVLGANGKVLGTSFWISEGLLTSVLLGEF